jgi:CHAT domain-containing protein
LLAGPAASMLEIREQYDHPYFWSPFMVIGDGLTSGTQKCTDLSA